MSTVEGHPGAGTEIHKDIQEQERPHISEKRRLGLLSVLFILQLLLLSAISEESSG